MQLESTEEIYRLRKQYKHLLYIHDKLVHQEEELVQENITLNNLLNSLHVYNHISYEPEETESLHEIASSSFIEATPAGISSCLPYDSIMGERGLHLHATRQKNLLLPLTIVKQAFDQFPACLFVIKSDGKVVYSNDFYKQHRDIQSYDPDYCLCKNLTNFSSKSNLNKLLNDIRKAHGYHTFIAQYQSSVTEGMGMLKFLSLRTINEGQELFWFFTTNLTDIFNQRNETMKLYDLMKAIIDSLPYYIYIKDSGDNMKYIFWNKKCQEITGLSTTQVFGKTYDELFTDSHKNNLSLFHKYDMDVLQTGKSINTQVVLNNTQGKSIVVHVQKFLVHLLNKPPLVVSLSNDMYKTKQIQKELIDARIKVEEANRLKEAIIHNVSHEVRTPLNAIVGFSDLFSMSSTKEEALQYLPIIRHNTQKLHRIFINIDEMYHVEFGQSDIIIAPFRVYDILQQAYEEFKDSPALRVQLIADEVNQNLLAEGDYIHCFHVLRDFILNAIKYTFKGSIHIGFFYRKRNDTIVVYVADTGIGISAQERETVFRRFEQVNFFDEGIGLGLPLGKIAIERMNGILNFVSKKGKGSIFYFQLPAHQGADV